jgi:glycine dehydrogenase subunit 1
VGGDSSSLSHPYISNDPVDIQRKLLDAIGISSVDEAFSDIPKKVRLAKSPSLPKPESEAEVRREMERILSKNVTSKDALSFLGGGVWSHHVPAAVDALAGRGEFLTSYTPYQPEISQGMLQSLFEYQSMMAELLEVDVVNSSLYDWASALGEAARMSARITRRNEFVVPHLLSPERLAVLKSYANPIGIRIREVRQSLHTGQISLEALKEEISPQTAGLYVENPAYLGHLVHNVEALAEITHDAGSLFVVGVDPTSLGVLKPPGRYDADIVVGEGQPLGNYVNYGGPLLGIFACRNDPQLIRQMPGRLVGLTTTKDGGEQGYCLVLQTREQHIRREKATSNICTNHALSALRAAIYMALMGGGGFRRLGEHLLAITRYATQRLSKVDGVRVPVFQGCHFKDFTVNFDETGKKGVEVSKHLLKRGILGGQPLGKDFPELGDTFLYSVTEMHSQGDVDTLYEALKEIMEV